MSKWKETEIGKIPIDWEITSLGQICDLITDGSHSSPKLQDSPFFMASVKDMRYNYFDFTNCKTISEEDFHVLDSNNCSPLKGDIIISKDGANCLDLIFVYNQPEKIVLLSSIAIARVKAGFDPYFYRYYLLSPNAQFLMKNQFVSGSAIPRVILKDFKNIPVPLIPYNTQKNIASVLSSLDDKIDLLHRQNKTLEALAETLFRQWFVEEADSTWSEGKITDLIEINPTRKLPPKTIAPYLEMSNVNESAYHPKNWYDREFTSGTKFINGDTLLARITPCLENGKTTYVDFLSTDTVGWGSTEFIVMHTKQHIHPFISYLFARDEDFRNHAISSMSGSSGRQRVDIASLTDYEVMIPPDENIRKLNDFVEPIVMKLGNNSRQIRTLESLRDALLPKLMSGEVRVQYNEQVETEQKNKAVHKQQELPFGEAIAAT